MEAPVDIDDLTGGFARLAGSQEIDRFCLIRGSDGLLG